MERKLQYDNQNTLVGQRRQRRPAPFKNSTVFFGGIRRIPRGVVGKQSPTDSPSVNPFSYRYLRFVKKRGKESFI